jgi:hypothetical protein
MRTATLDDLIKADDQEHSEAPPGFARVAAMQEVAALREPLSKLVGLKFEQDMNVQDASFFTELYVHEPPRNRVIQKVVGIRFSAFARFFTISGNSLDHPLTDDIRQPIMEFVCGHNFVFVPDALLELRYRDPKMFPHWEVRFFDYL